MSICFRYSLRFFFGIILFTSVAFGITVTARREFLSAIESLSTAGVSVARYDTPRFDIFPQLGTYYIRIDEKIRADKLRLLRKVGIVQSFRWDNPDPDDLKILASMPHVEQLEITNGKDSICPIIAKAKTMLSLSVSGTSFSGYYLSDLSSIRGLRSLDLSHSALVDDSMKKVSMLTELESLSVAHTEITDLGIDDLQLIRLESLNLEGTMVTDNCLPKIAKLVSLKYLNVRGCSVSEEGLCTHLARISLKNLSVTSVVLDKAGMSKLQRTFPQCSINASVEFKFNSVLPQAVEDTAL